MYLSRVEIDINDRRRMRDLKHLGCYHGWIEDSFPEERDKEKNDNTRKLWRIDNLNDRYYLIVLSKTKPDLEKLEKYGVKNSASTKDYDDFLNSLTEGMQANFRIKLNTVRSRSDRKKYPKRGHLELVPLNELNSFFLDRTDKNGFSVKSDEFWIVNRNKEAFKRYDQDEYKKVNQYLVSATYEGILTITDLEKFKQALQSGIGKKKAYGFGFLTIIPIK